MRENFFYTKHEDGKVGSTEDPGRKEEPWELTSEEFEQACRKLMRRPYKESEAMGWRQIASEIPNGSPGVSYEMSDQWPRFIFRDDSGVPRGALSFTGTKPAMESSWVVVDPSFRRQGIAASLFAAAKEAGYDTVSIDTTDSFSPSGLRLKHHTIIKQAIESGKIIPPWILAEYPDLEAKYQDRETRI
ncbi:MAG TPA: hypothetical protein DIS62_01455 [Candidatus Kerfeldbacteria bacterium]|nr:hypothetical protein [Candidatus Kerfeldbacteria bacterium]